MGDSLEREKVVDVSQFSSNCIDYLLPTLNCFDLISKLSSFLYFLCLPKLKK